MSGFWKRGDELESRLRACRPQPREEFLSGLMARTTSRPRMTFRIGALAGLTSVFVLAFAVCGGLGYAGSAAKSVGTAAKIVAVGKPKSATVKKAARPALT